MQLSELFDLSLRVYRTLGWRILVASAAPSLFTLAGIAFLFQYVIPGFALTKEGSAESAQVTQAAVNLLLGTVVAGPLMLIGISLATTYVAPLVSNFMHGLAPDFKAAQEAQWKTAPRMLWVSVRESLLAASGTIAGGFLLFASWGITQLTPEDNAVAGIVMVLGIFALVVGGIGALFVVSTHALVAPIAVLENVDAKIAGRRSRELMKSRPYHGGGYDSVWTLYLLLAMLIFILGAGSATLTQVAGVHSWAIALNLRSFQPILEGAVGLIPYYLTLWVIVPVWAVTVTIIYFERRVRLEGYDIEALAADVWRSDGQDPVRTMSPR